MHTKINAVTERIRKKVQDVNVGRALYTAFLIPTAVAATLERPMSPSTAMFHTLRLMTLPRHLLRATVLWTR